MITALSVTIAVYGGMVTYMWLFQRKFLFRADRNPVVPADYGLPEMRTVELAAADGLKLRAWYRPAATADAPVILYFHGNDAHLGTRSDKIRPYLDAGYGVLLMSYRGYGGNPGQPSEQGLYHDARAAVGFLSAQGIEPENVVYYGESLGSGVAVQLALEISPAAMILEAPYTDIRSVGQRRYPFLPVRLLMRDRFDNLSKIADIESPVLVIHGEQDKTTPVHHGRTIHAAAPDPKEARFYADAAHLDLYEFGAAEDVLRFIEAHHPNTALRPNKNRIELTET